MSDEVTITLGVRGQAKPGRPGEYLPKVYPALRPEEVEAALVVSCGGNAPYGGAAAVMVPGTLVGHGDSVQVRFDKQPSERLPAHLGRNFVAFDYAMLSRMKRHNEVLVRIPIFNKGNADFRFPLHGVTKAVEEHCLWK